MIQLEKIQHLHMEFSSLCNARCPLCPSDLFVKDKYVSEEIRNFAKEMQILLVTASQLNRASVEEVEFDHSHISGGISKINTADNLFGIFTSRSMREHGKYQLQIMKTRSSSGVGQKVELEFDVDSLRIRDLPDDDSQSSQFRKPTSNIFDGLKTGSVVKAAGNTDTDASKVTATVDSSRLKSMLANIKSAK